MSNANAVVKSFSSFSVSEGLLAKVVDAVKQGESLARRSGQIRSFEIFYHGFRTNLVLGRIMVIPAAVADSIEDFPSALLYGAMVKELSGETLSDAFTYKMGENEFDQYNPKDLADIKDRLFKDVDGKYRSLVMFIPTWAAPRDYVTFKFVKDDEKLSMLLRHLVFAAYFDPRFSSSFEKLTEETTSSNLNVVDITPKLNYPFLAEGLMKNYPELQPGDKRASSAQKPRIILAKETLGDVSEELLEPGEQAVMNALGEDLEQKLGSEKEAALPQTEHDAHRDHAHATGKGRTCTWKHMSQDGQCSNCGFDGSKKATVSKAALGFTDETGPLQHGETVVWKGKDHEINKTTGTVEGDHIRWEDGTTTRVGDAVAMSNVERAPKTAALPAPAMQPPAIVRPANPSGEVKPALKFPLTVQAPPAGTVKHAIDNPHGFIEVNPTVDRDVAPALPSHTGAAPKTAVDAEGNCTSDEYCPQCGKDAQSCACSNKEDLLKKNGHMVNVPAVKFFGKSASLLPVAFASAKTVGEQLTLLRTAATAKDVDPKVGAKLTAFGSKIVDHVNTRMVRAALAGFCQCGKSDKTAAKASCPCCGAPVSPLKQLLSEYVEKHGGTIPEALYVNVESDYVATEPPAHHNYIYVSKSEAERILGKAPARQQPTPEEQERQRRTDAILNGQPEGKAAAKKEACTAEETCPEADANAKKAQVVLAQSGAKLLVVSNKFVAKADSGYTEPLTVNASSIKWQRPNQFTRAFKQAAERLIRLPRVANLLKKADVPQSIEEIWSDKMEDMGPAPEVAVAATPGVVSESAPSSESAAPAAGKSHVEKMHERRGEDENGKPNVKEEVSPKSEGEEAEEKKPWEKDASWQDRRDETLREKGSFGDCSVCGKPVGKHNEQQASECKSKKTAKIPPIGICANCKFNVTASSGSEIAPELFMHAACQRALHQAYADKLVPHQVLATFYPEVLRSRSMAIRASVEQAMKVLREKHQIPDNTEFADLSPNEQQTVLSVSRKLHVQNEYAKAASFDLFIPGQVAQEFAPETLHEIVDFPEQSYNPLISDVGPAPGGPYVTTDPAGAMGIGADGKPQVLDGAPLRKPEDVRGPMFDQEFYQQYQGISPDGLRAASVAARVRKNADANEYKQQFADFLKKVVGEVAATFIAAFKVTMRPMMNQVPGTGEIQLQNVEQNSQATLMNGYNMPNAASRVSFLVDKLNDSDIQAAINSGWAKAEVYNDDENGGYVYEVFVRPESLDQDTLVLRYSFVVGTKGL